MSNKIAKNVFLHYLQKYQCKVRFSHLCFAKIIQNTPRIYEKRRTNLCVLLFVKYCVVNLA